MYVAIMRIDAFFGELVIQTEQTRKRVSILITFVYIFLNIWLKITNNGSQKTLKRNFIHWGKEKRNKDDDKTI
jgi:hypothetical protein